MPSRDQAPPRATRPRRALSHFDRVVRVPLGFLWLAVIGVVAVPVLIGMTFLYYVTHAAESVAGGRSEPPVEMNAGDDRDA
ncbi:MAG TPA: hypothetical protein VFT43_04910 [Candidatus Polarisedimenticolia bacterium]|nr:hypothetical protein [Candidatus Polarisedimenticolia bacterium]